LSKDDFDELETISFENFIWINSDDLLYIYNTRQYPEKMTAWLRSKLRTDRVVTIKKGQKRDEVILTQETIQVLKKFKILSANGFDYAEIINRSPIIVFIWKITEGWPVEFVSDNVSILGYSPEDFTTGKISWPGITHEEDVPRLEKEVANYLKDGQDEWRNVYRLYTGYGDYRWIEDRNKVLYDSNGNPEYIQGLIFDITKQKKFDDRLQSLHSHAIELAKTITLDEVSRITADTIPKLFTSKRFSIGFVDGDVFKAVVRRNLVSPEMSLKGPGITVRAILTSKTQRVGDTRLDEDYISGVPPGELESLSELDVPIKVGDSVVGVMNLESTDLNAFTYQDQILLEIFAEHVASAFDRIQRIDRVIRE
jgi:PAS domain S-box-containing protein